MKLSDFLKQQGDTPQGKSTYQAFIDNFDKDYTQTNTVGLDAESFRKDEKCSIAAAFQWDICPEDLEFWDIVDNKWEEVTDPENDMLWLLDGKEPPKETDEELSKQKEYPRWFKSTETEMIVQFDSLQSGKVIGGSVAFADGYYTTTWKPHTDTDTWQEVPNPELTQENEINNTDGKRKQIGGDHYAGHNNGGNTDYYKLPEGATELQDIIEHKKMHWNIANMFKALYRMGQQDHSSIERDLNKIEYFLKRHKELLRKDML